MNKVVARFRDGRVLKGMALDLDPAKPLFHLRPVEGGKASEVRLDDLKAIFFVRSFEGDPQRTEPRAVDPGDPRARGATTVSFTFEDDETVVGLAIRFPPIKPFHYIVPVDPGSNNIRILINQSAVRSMQALS
jgi:Family of unknown function (DUF6982)